MGIAVAVSRIFDLIFLLLFVTILLSWFPNIRWYNQPFRFLKEFSDIFLGPFRRIIPPIGMIDFSPIVAFICLSILARLIITLLVSLGL